MTVRTTAEPSRMPVAPIVRVLVMDVPPQASACALATLTTVPSRAERVGAVQTLGIAGASVARG